MSYFDSHAYMTKGTSLRSFQTNIGKHGSTRALVIQRRAQYLADMHQRESKYGCLAPRRTYRAVAKTGRYQPHYHR